MLLLEKTTTFYKILKFVYNVDMTPFVVCQ